MDITCVHAAAGLCPQCRADFDEDPQAYLEYGDHPAGLERYRALLEEMAQRPEPLPEYDDSHIPF